MNFLDSFSSVAIFGSVARGDNDAFSDRDILVISEKPTTQRNIKAIHENGFSPSIYTWNELESLSRHNALFLLHLKLESKIIKDDQNRLSGFLTKIEPSNNYSLALKQSVALAGLTSGVPATRALSLWAADVLAVALRNYLVAFAAEKRKYIFAHHSLIDFADSLFQLTPEARETLLDLRRWKSIYRGKGEIVSSEPPFGDQIELAQSAFSCISGIKIATPRLSVQEFGQKLMDNRDASEPWYHSVRRYEGAYRATPRDYFTKKQEKVITQQISSPSCYSSDGQVSWQKLRYLISAAHLRSLH
jgi:hypothetical protein